MNTCPPPLTNFSSPLRPNMSAANRGGAPRGGRKRSREPDDDLPSSSAAPPSSRQSSIYPSQLNLPLTEHSTTVFSTSDAASR